MEHRSSLSANCTIAPHISQQSWQLAACDATHTRSARWSGSRRRSWKACIPLHCRRRALFYRAANGTFVNLQVRSDRLRPLAALAVPRDSVGAFQGSFHGVTSKPKRHHRPPATLRFLRRGGGKLRRTDFALAKTGNPLLQQFRRAWVQGRSCPREWCRSCGEVARRSDR